MIPGCWVHIDDTAILGGCIKLERVPGDEVEQGHPRAAFRRGGKTRVNRSTGMCKKGTFQKLADSKCTDL